MDSFLNKAERIERLRYLSIEGFDVYMIATHSKERHYLSNNNVHLISIPIRYIPFIYTILYGIILFLFLPVYIIIIRPDYIISDPEIIPFLVWKPILSRLLKFKMILDIRSTPVETFGLHGSLQNINFNTSLYIARKILDGITIVTIMMKKEICQKFNIDPSFVTVLSNGVPNELLTFDRNYRFREELREKYTLTGKFVILYHGSLRMTGGLIESIKAMALVKEEHNDITLFLLGSGSVYNLLERKIQENGVQDNVILHKEVDFWEVPKYISMCDVGLIPLLDIPSWRHQQPVKLLEYLAMEKTIIITDIPAHRSIIGESINGIYLKSVNPTEITKAITFAYDHRDSLNIWGKVGSDIAEKYTWKRVTRNLINILENYG